jgi:hypothetical protein
MQIILHDGTRTFIETHPLNPPPNASLEGVKTLSCTLSIKIHHRYCGYAQQEMPEQENLRKLWPQAQYSL